MPQSRAFILQQTLVLTRLGVSPIDISRSIAWVDAHLPEDEDAASWQPSAADLSDDGLLTEAAVADARVAYYADPNVPRKFKRILDARGEA